jgi:hypothetical protein
MVFVETIDLFNATQGLESISWYRGYISALRHNNLVTDDEASALISWVNNHVD